MQRSWQNRFLLSFSSNPSEILEVNTARPQPVHELGNSCYVKQVLIGNRHTEPCLTTISSKHRDVYVGCTHESWGGRLKSLQGNFRLSLKGHGNHRTFLSTGRKQISLLSTRRVRRTEEPQASQPHFSAWEGGIVNPLGNPLPNTWRTRWLEKDGMDLQRGNQA